MCYDKDMSSAMTADVRLRGVLPLQAEALFDVWVTDTDAASYVNHSIAAVLSTAEEK